MQTDPPNRIVVGISGASGAAYAVRTMELAARLTQGVHQLLLRLGRLRRSWFFVNLALLGGSDEWA